MTIGNIVKKQRLKRRPCCTSEITVFEAAVEIAALEVNALGVLDAGKLVGIITEQDILRCLVDSGSDFYDQTVSDWMSADPVICSVGSKLSTALNLMAKHNIRNLVVMQDKLPITIVSSKEILSEVHERDELELRVLRDLASTPRDGATA